MHKMHNHKPNGKRTGFRKIINRVRSKLIAYNGLTKTKPKMNNKHASIISVDEDESTWVSTSCGNNENNNFNKTEICRAVSPAPCKNQKNHSCEGRIMRCAFMFKKKQGSTIGKIVESDQESKISSKNSDYSTPPQIRNRWDRSQSVVDVSEQYML